MVNESGRRPSSHATPGSKCKGLVVSLQGSVQFKLSSLHGSQAAPWVAQVIPRSTAVPHPQAKNHQEGLPGLLNTSGRLKYNKVKLK